MRRGRGTLSQQEVKIAEKGQPEREVFEEGDKEGGQEKEEKKKKSGVTAGQMFLSGDTG